MDEDTLDVDFCGLSLYNLGGGRMSEVVKIRISEDTKKALQDVAKKEYRSFAEQCRLILDTWVSSNCPHVWNKVVSRREKSS